MLWYSLKRKRCLSLSLLLLLFLLTGNVRDDKNNPIRKKWCKPEKAEKCSEATVNCRSGGFCVSLNSDGALYLRNSWLPLFLVNFDFWNNTGVLKGLINSCYWCSLITWYLGFSEHFKATFSGAWSSQVYGKVSLPMAGGVMRWASRSFQVHPVWDSVIPWFCVCVPAALSACLLLCLVHSGILGVFLRSLVFVWSLQLHRIDVSVSHYWSVPWSDNS